MFGMFLSISVKLNILKVRLLGLVPIFQYRNQNSNTFQLFSGRSMLVINPNGYGYPELDVERWGFGRGSATPTIFNIYFD